MPLSRNLATLALHAFAAHKQLLSPNFSIYKVSVSVPALFAPLPAFVLWVLSTPRVFLLCFGRSPYTTMHGWLTHSGREGKDPLPGLHGSNSELEKTLFIVFTARITQNGQIKCSHQAIKTIARTNVCRGGKERETSFGFAHQSNFVLFCSCLALKTIKLFLSGLMSPAILFSARVNELFRALSRS